MNSYIISCRSIDKDDNKFGKSVDNVNYLQVPNNVLIPTPTHKMDNVQSFMKAVTDQANGATHIILMVHGYNTDEVHSLASQRLLQTQLNNRGVNCIVVGFDWPTASNVLLYEYDRIEAHTSSHVLAMNGLLPFTMFQRPDCPFNVHIVAHSMGCYVVREAFRTLDKIRISTLPLWKISQLIFVAADLSSDSFKIDDADMFSIFNHVGRLTNYFSGYDIALAASNAKRLGTSPRIGKIGMPMDVESNPKAVDIDCSARFYSLNNDTPLLSNIALSHHWYFADYKWHEDVAQTIIGNVDRNLISTRIKIDENDFKLKI
jgi:esterase/lipase superfamily enzyme